MKKQKLEKRLNVKFLSPDGKVVKAEGFMSIYTNGVVYLNKDLTKRLGNSISWMKVGFDDNRKLMVMKPSEKPFNSFRVEKVGNAIRVRRIPRSLLKEAFQNRKTVYIKDGQILSTLI